MIAGTQVGAPDPSSMPRTHRMTASGSSGTSGQPRAAYSASVHRGTRVRSRTSPVISAARPHVHPAARPAPGWMPSTRPAYLSAASATASVQAVRASLASPDPETPDRPPSRVATDAWRAASVGSPRGGWTVVTWLTTPNGETRLLRPPAPASLEDVNSRVMGPARILSGTVAPFIAAAAALEIGGFGTDEEQRCQRVRVLGENAFQGVLKHVYADVQ